MKKIILSFIFIFYFSTLNAELIKPSNKFEPYDVVKIQLKALKNNNEKDQGIMQTWLFAHPDNKKVTGPYERFRIMIYSIFRLFRSKCISRITYFAHGKSGFFIDILSS